MTTLASVSLGRLNAWAWGGCGATLGAINGSDVVEKNYRPFLEEAIESKKRRQYASLERLWDDPSVPQKTLRAMDRARGFLLDPR